MKHQVDAAKRFQSGLVRHGIESLVVSASLFYACDLAVFWGHRQKEIINHQRKNGAHYLVMERGYIGDRFKWTSLGFDGLNGRAKFPDIFDGLHRWLKHFQELEQPWQAKYANVALIMGQVPGDASIEGVDFVEWATRKAHLLRKEGWIVMFRRHPQCRNMELPLTMNMPGDLQDALKNACKVFTFNSNSGVDAIMAGVPAMADDAGSMIYGLDGGYFDRKPWEQKMSYTQWTEGEIERGEAWEALKTVI